MYVAVDLQYGPDGGVYVIDWSDTQHCHNPATEIWDRTNGRLYRVAWAETFRPVTVNLAAKTDATVTNGIDVSRIYQTTTQAPRDWDATEADRAAKQDAAIAAWTSDTNSVDVRGPKPEKYKPAAKPTWLVDWEKEHKK
jgi:hypothetical protein